MESCCVGEWGVWSVDFRGVTVASARRIEQKSPQLEVVQEADPILSSSRSSRSRLAAQ